MDANGAVVTRWRTDYIGSAVMFCRVSIELVENNESKTLDTVDVEQHLGYNNLQKLTSTSFLVMAISDTGKPEVTSLPSCFSGF